MGAEALQKLLEDEAHAGGFPLARAEVWQRGKQLFVGGIGDPHTLFDLASITKVMATTSVFASLWAERRLSPDTLLGRFFPVSPAAGATLADLLTHRSGLPAWSPFFAEVVRQYPELLDPQASLAVRAAARGQVVALAATTPLELVPRKASVYSDVGFILLGEVVARAGIGDLASLFANRVARPLGLAAHFRPLTAPDPGDVSFAETGRTRPREPAPGQEMTWLDLGTVPARPGEVDDDNAWAMNGVSGHAGVFATVADVAHFGIGLLAELAGASQIAPVRIWDHLVTRDTVTPHSTRALGFDTPSDVGSSAGSFIGKQPPGAFGHTGFTGTSLWVDRARELVVAFCSNRTLPGRGHNRMQQFRPRFHDAVIVELGL